MPICVPICGGYCDIEGFRTGSSNSGPGDVIRTCQPKLVIQPWTEDPDLDTAAEVQLEPAKQEELHNDLNALIVRMNRSGDDTMVVPSEYLEVVITKR